MAVAGTGWSLLNLAESAEPPALDQAKVDRRFYAIVADQVGMPVGLLDPDTGALAGRAVTRLWGRATWSGESTPLRFPGQYADDESGLFYNLFRYYSPGTARFLTPDPLGLAPAPNPYAYPTNPTTTADPLGLMPCPPTHPESPIVHGPVEGAVHQRLRQIDTGEWPRGHGTRGGSAFHNTDRRTLQPYLPTHNDFGIPIQYREWDMNARIPNAARDSERIVTGDDGSAWYSKDHYATFLRIR